MRILKPFVCIFLATFFCFAIFLPTAFAADVIPDPTSKNEGYQLTLQAQVDPRISGNIVVTVTNEETGKNYTNTLYSHNNYTLLTRVQDLGVYTVTLCEIPDNWDFRYEVEYASITLNPNVTNYLYFKVGDPNFNEKLDHSIDKDGDGWVDDEKHGIFEESETELDSSEDVSNGNRVEAEKNTLLDQTKNVVITILVVFVLVIAAIVTSAIIIRKRNQ